MMLRERTGYFATEASLGGGQLGSLEAAGGSKGNWLAPGDSGRLVS